MLTALLIVLSLLLALYKLLEAVFALRVEDTDRKTVVISGCDTGFGYLLALRLVRQQIPVVAGVLTERGGQELLAAANNSKLLHVLPLDVSSDASVQEFSQRVGEHVGSAGIWGVVCNAGILGATGPDELLAVDDYIRTMQVNTFGVMRFVHGLVDLVKIQRGRIVIIASVSGRTPRPTVGPYCVSKHAVEAYADVIRHELLDFGVSVHVLEPGFFATNITQSATANLDAVWERAPQQKKDVFGKRFFDQYVEGRRSALSHCYPDLTPVVDAYERALFARFTLSRYWVGLDAIFFYIPLATLPTEIQNLVIRFQRRARPLPQTARPTTLLGLF